MHSSEGRGLPAMAPPYPTRLGDLLCHRSLDPLFRLRTGLGGEESEASLDAGTEAQRVRLEEVE